MTSDILLIGTVPISQNGSLAARYRDIAVDLGHLILTTLETDVAAMVASQTTDWIRAWQFVLVE